ncbi:oligoribonuclease, mitochondrial [Pelodytes ibericus]
MLLGRFAVRVISLVSQIPASRQLFRTHRLAFNLCKRWKMADTEGQRMVWVDLEMTGLDIEKDEIIEMACLITDADLNIICEGPNVIIHQPEELLVGMSDWCKEHHGKSGLTQAVRESQVTLQQAEYEFLAFIRQHTPPWLCPLAGNSVHADKKFLDKYMPQFMNHLHYRIIDVSTVKELCRRWYAEEYENAPKKKASHRDADSSARSQLGESPYANPNSHHSEVNVLVISTPFTGDIRLPQEK